MIQQVTTRVITSAIIILFTISSCRKASVNYFQPPVSASLAKVKSVDFATGIRTNEYDLQGRWIKATYNSGAKTETIYSGNTVTVDSYNPSGTLAQKDINTLNSDGLIASATNSNNLPSVFTYMYNSEKKLIKDVYINNGILKRERFYEYSNGNLIKDSTAEGTGWYTNNYEYYLDILSTIEAANYGYELYGTGNKNAVKKIIYKVSDGTINTKIYTAPEKDPAGRIITTTYSLNGGAPVIYKYTYY